MSWFYFLNPLMTFMWFHLPNTVINCTKQTPSVGTPLHMKYVLILFPRGVILYAMVTGKLPYHEKLPCKLVQLIRKRSTIQQPSV